MGYVVITGASSGIGYALALKYASLGYDLILTARSEDKLNDLREKIEHEYDKKCIVIPCDLVTDGKNFSEKAISMGLPIEIVVNNAGAGLSGEFLNHSLEDERNIIGLNVTALMEICHAFGNYFKKLEHGKIVNISSVGSYMPGPYIASYYASKSFVSSFSLSLSSELKPYKVEVYDMHLPKTDTDFDLHAGRKGNMKKGHSVSWCVDKISKAATKRRCIVRIGVATKMAYLAEKILPKKIYVSIVIKSLRNS